MFSFEEINSSRDSIDEFMDFNYILLDRMVKNYEKNKLDKKRKAVLYENFDTNLTRKATISEKISNIISKMNLY